jgi:hypothetical protein
MGFLPVILIAAAMASAQQFEVVSIKPAKPGNPGMGFHSPPGRIVMENVTLRYLIGMAWMLHEHQLEGAPAWIDSPHLDIEAKPATETPWTQEGFELRRRMMQSLQTASAWSSIAKPESFPCTRWWSRKAGRN